MMTKNENNWRKCLTFSPFSCILSVDKERNKNMTSKFVKVEAVFAHAAEHHQTVELDGRMYWVKRRETDDGWDLQGRKCSSTTVMDWELEDGSFYDDVEDVQYFF